MKPIQFKLILLQTFFAFNLFSQNSNVVEATSWWSSLSTLDVLLVVIAGLLLIPILYFSKLLKYYIRRYIDSFWNKKTGVYSILILTTLTAPIVASAQDTAGVLSAATSGLSMLQYFLIFIIILEVVVLIFFARILWKAIALMESQLVGEERTEVQKESALMRWWRKSNNFIPFDKEADLDTGHNYDGIRELDNNIPSWFTATFVITVFIAMFYLWYYHGAKIAPLSAEEYELANQEAEVEHERYLKTAGSNVDENNISFSTVNSDIEAGKKYYIANCATCHIADGGGNQGPNLTDNSWIYGCEAKDIYKTIKYGGKPGAGMQAWKDNFNDKQILELVSYVNSLKGTKPVKPKDPQGSVCEVKLMDSASVTILKDTSIISVK